MSTYSLPFNNLITVPRFDVMFHLSNNNKIMLKDTYMRFIALFCFFGGVKLFWNYLTRSPYYIRKLMSNVLSKTAKPNKLVLIIGFGDIKSLSTTCIDTFIKLGYKIICLYNTSNNENQTKATSLVSEENLKRCVEIYKEEDFFNDKTSRKIDIEFVIDISYEVMPFIGDSKTLINFEKVSLKLTNYQKIFEYCLAKKFFDNVKVYQFFTKNKPFSPSERFVLDNTFDINLRI